MRLHELVNEIQEYKNDLTHKSVLNIFRILDNNQKLFSEAIEADNFNHILSHFEQLSYGNPTQYQSADYRQECRKHYDLLLFYINRIV